MTCVCCLLGVTICVCLIAFTPNFLKCVLIVFYLQFLRFHLIYCFGKEAVRFRRLYTSPGCFNKFQIREPFFNGSTLTFSIPRYVFFTRGLSHSAVSTLGPSLTICAVSLCLYFSIPTPIRMHCIVKSRVPSGIINVYLTSTCTKILYVSKSQSANSIYWFNTFILLHLFLFITCLDQPRLRMCYDHPLASSDVTNANQSGPTFFNTAHYVFALLQSQYHVVFHKSEVALILLQDGWVTGWLRFAKYVSTSCQTAPKVFPNASSYSARSRHIFWVKLAHFQHEMLDNILILISFFLLSSNLVEILFELSLKINETPDESTVWFLQAPKNHSTILLVGLHKMQLI